MQATINRDVLAGKWKEIRGQVKQTWGKLTDNDLDRIGGRFEEFVGLVQQRYGYTRERAEQEIDNFMEKIHLK